MSATEIAGIAVAVAAFLAVVVNLANVLLTQANERRRSQPIVVTHEEQSRMFAGEGIWNVKVRVTNEGPTPAFNVRYGVSYFGARFAFRLFEEDPLGGNRHRVLHPREPLRSVVSIPSLDLFGGAGKKKRPPEEDAFYWARFENTRGQTWETINPPDRSAGLKIRRIRFPKIREKLEVRRRLKLTGHGEAAERAILGEMRAEAKSDASMDLSTGGEETPLDD